MTGRTFRVTGRVQGVGYRWWTRREAVTLGVVGGVRNEPEGSVLVRAWAPDAVLAELERRLWEGPPGARVEAVEVLPPLSEPAPDGFTIDR